MKRNPVGLNPRRFKSKENIYQKYLGNTIMTYPARVNLEHLKRELEEPRWRRSQLGRLWDFMKRLELND